MNQTVGSLKQPGKADMTTTHVLAGGGEMGALMRSIDWSQTPLGPVETWPQSLKTAVRIMLTSRQPIWLGWGEQLINLYNDPYKAILGGKHPAALGQPVALVWREIWDAIGPMLQTAMGGVEGTYVEAQLLIMERNGYPEETYYTFSYSPIPDDEGGVGGIICANTDDTQHVIGERQLALLRELAAKTVDARTLAEACARSIDCLATNPYDLPFAMIYLVEPDAKRVVLAGRGHGIESGHVLAPETAAFDSTTWPFAEVLAANRTCLVADLSAFAHTLPTGAWDRPPHQAVAMPIALQGRPGTAGILVVGLNPYRLFDDNYRGFLELVASQIGTSIATVQAYEEERKRAEALAELDRAKTVFFSNVSHEFRTPLTLMIGPLEDLLQQADGALRPEQREQLEVAHRNSLRLLRLVNTLLDFSRIEAGRIQASYEPTDLATFTAELASVFRSAIERAGLELIVTCPPLTEAVYVDREMWEKIVLNLLSNAFKFTFVGQIEVSLRQAGAIAELMVRDTGIGIPADELPHLFERFHRGKGRRGRTFEGSGIGLALVQELAKLHGGVVRVESEVDRGSTVTVSIPLGTTHLPADRIGAARASASTSLRSAAYIEEALRWLPGANSEPRSPEPEMKIAAAPEPRSSPPDGQKAALARILLADDNADMREYIRRLLSEEYDVVAVGDGIAALRAARERTPDLVLSDVMMPELDGIGLLKALRADERLKTVPVILLSARAGEEAQVEGLEAGADDYLIKPFNARELLARVSARLELARLRTQLNQERAALVNLFMQSPIPIAVLRGPKLIFDLANPAYLQVIDDRNIVGKPLVEALPELATHGFDDLLRNVMHTGTPVIGHEALVRLNPPHHGEPVDTYWTFIYAPLHNTGGQIDSIIAICNEVTEQVRARQKLELLTTQLTAELTERKQAEAALRASEEQLRLALDAGKLGTWQLDLTNLHLTASEHCKAHFGRAPEEPFSYEQFRASIYPEDWERVETVFSRAMEKAGDYEAEYRCVWPDGSIHWILGGCRTIVDSAGQTMRIVGVTLDITERKRNEQRLVEQARLLDLSNDTIFVRDAEGRITFWNNGAVERYGYTREEALGRTTHELLHTVFPEPLEQIYEQLHRDGLWTGECVHTRKDGSTIVVMSRWALDRDEQGNPVAILETNMDITASKQAEEALREEQARRLAEEQQHASRLHQLNAASLAINAATTRGEVLRLITEEARKLIGAHQAVASTTSGQNWAQAITDVSFSEKYAQWKDYATRPDGSGIYALVCQLNKPMRMTQAELEAHPAWKGFGKEAGKHPPMRGWLAAPLVGRDGRNLGLIQLSDKQDGSEFDETDEAMLVQLAQAAIALEKQTIYEQEQAARMQAEEASRLKDEFLATVSHELRTPLTAFLGYAQMLQRRTYDQAYVARTVTRMVRSAKDQAQIIDDLLDVSRVVSGKLRIEPRPIDLIPVIRGALDTVRPAVEAKGLHLHVDLRREASAIIGDANRLQQVVWNLLSNATKFTPAGGTIRVRLEPHYGAAQLTVSDTGQGINPDFLPFVFDRFRQADSTSQRVQGGLGLGLAIVRHLIELHGGTVQATSAGEGQGATFMVRLPLADDTTTPRTTVNSALDRARIDAECPPELDGLRVVVVDDQRDILELLHEILTPCGAVVQMCHTAREALETVRAWRPDVLVSDIAMPGDDGYWLIRNVRALAPEEGGTIPAVALTAYVRMEERLRVLAAGFQLYVPKPVDPADLRDVVARIARTAAAD